MVSIIQLLQDYRNDVTKANAMIALAHTVDAAGNNVWGVDERITITEFSFLKGFIAWESFLEKSFIYYLRGNLTASNTVVPCHVRPIDDAHANRILIGVNRYVDWTNPDIVRKLAGLFFDRGNPFETILSSIQTDLYDLKIIRNASAHISSTTGSQLDSLSTRKLQRPCTNMTVYSLILVNDPNIPNQTILQSYADILDAAAVQITG